MKLHSMSKAALVVLVSISLLATGCSAQWISVALADLPVLTQMALNIGTLVTTLQTGQHLNASEASAIQNISTQASKDLNLLQALYNEYKANPGANSLQQIQGVIADISQNLPALLQAAHISDPTLSARVAAAVNLILATVSSFAQLIPSTPGMVTAQKVAAKPSAKVAVPHADDLKTQWNEQICGPTGNSVFDSATAACVVR